MNPGARDLDRRLLAWQKARVTQPCVDGRLGERQRQYIIALNRQFDPEGKPSVSHRFHTQEHKNLLGNLHNTLAPRKLHVRARPLQCECVQSLTPQRLPRRSDHSYMAAGTSGRSVPKVDEDEAEIAVVFLNTVV